MNNVFGITLAIAYCGTLAVCHYAFIPECSDNLISNDTLNNITSIYNVTADCLSLVL